MKRLLLPISISAAVVVAGAIIATIVLHAGANSHSSAGTTTSPSLSQATIPNPSPATSASPATSQSLFDKTTYSTTDPSSIWAIVNKTHPVSPSSYAPSDLVTLYNRPLRNVLASDLHSLMDASKSDGVNLTILSGYRSYASQTSVYNGYVKTDGQANADTYSARPGFSEHQLGLAMDFGNTANQCAVEQCFGDTAEAKWLAANAYKYGFLLRYTPEDQSVTGYEAEPWHYRYIGKDLAKYMHDNNISTLEAMFGVSGGQTYN